MPADRMQQMTVSYGPGTSAALAMDSLWLLADLKPDDELVIDMWQSLIGPPRDNVVDEIAARVSSGRGRGLALARIADGVLMVAVSGTGSVEVATGDRVECLMCPESAAVVEYRLLEPPDAIAMEIGSEISGSLLPFAAGVVSAGRLHISWGMEPPTAELEVASDLPSRPDERSRPPSVSGETVIPSAAIGDFTLILPDEIEPQRVTDSGPKVDVGTASSVGEPDRDSGYDFLFGHTVHRSVGEAAVHPAEDPEMAGQTHTSQVSSVEERLVDGEQGVGVPSSMANGTPLERADLPTSTGVELATPPSGPNPIVRAKTTGMIDSVPWSPDSIAGQAPGSTPTEETDGAAYEESEDLGLTVSRAQLNRMAASAVSEAGSGSVPSGPAVHAVRCPMGHPNPAHADSCRVCREPIAEQSPITLPRPVLGVLRFSTGDVITLDRGVLIGRKPSTSRSYGEDRPHLVRIPSPDQDISRVHAEISLDDWHVLVTDLNSTNGTVVARPGREPERLRPDQAALIEPGTVVTLADVVTFMFEATA